MDNQALSAWVKENLEYREGELFWRSGGGKKKIGFPAGTVSYWGYRKLGATVGGVYKKYAVHRLIYLLHHGYLPDQIDHIDGDKLNNRIENLRAATANQNQHNKKLQKNNKSGVKGVYYSRARKCWVAYAKINGKNVTRYHKDRELIELVAAEIRAKHHGEFARCA